jgi:hypothetical protein
MRTSRDIGQTLQFHGSIHTFFKSENLYLHLNSSVTGGLVTVRVKLSV